MNIVNWIILSCGVCWANMAYVCGHSLRIFLGHRYNGFGTDRLCGTWLEINTIDYLHPNSAVFHHPIVSIEQADRWYLLYINSLQIFSFSIRMLFFIFGKLFFCQTLYPPYRDEAITMFINRGSLLDLTSICIGFH